MRPAIALAVGVAALAVVTLAPAKELARARLTTTLPLGAAPGTTLHVRWSVATPDANGSRPFGASGMFVRLLSKTGASATTGFAGGSMHPDGRYAADVRVPPGGIGGIRIGLRGWTNTGRTGDLLFPVQNDPFTTPGGVRCDVTVVRSALTEFVVAYNRGDAHRLDRLFSRKGFIWYFATGPSRDLRGAKQDRTTLIPYFRARHRHGERLALGSYRFNGYDLERDLGHFQWSGRRRADDFRSGRWFEAGGKGALDCSRRGVSIALLLVGN